MVPDSDDDSNHVQPHWKLLLHVPQTKLPPDDRQTNTTAKDRPQLHTTRSLHPDPPAQTKYKNSSPASFPNMDTVRAQISRDKDTPDATKRGNTYDVVETSGADIPFAIKGAS